MPRVRKSMLARGAGWDPFRWMAGAWVGHALCGLIRRWKMVEWERF